MSLEENAARWTANKQEVGIEARVDVNDSQMLLNIQCQRKYFNAVKRLASALVADGVEFISKSFAFAVAAEDAEQESGRIKDFLSQRKEFLINLLLSDGYQPFIEAVRQDVLIQRMRYEFSTLTPTVDGWQKWDGSKLSCDGWVKPDGTVYSDEASCLLLSSTKSEESLTETA